MSTRRRALVTAATALITTMALACDEAEFSDFESEDVEFRDGTGQSGPLFNTSTIFTSDVPAIDTKGQDLAGVKLVSVRLLSGGFWKPIDAGSLRAEHGVLKATVDGGVAVSATSFVHSRWTFKVNGVLLTARLATVETADAAGLYAPLMTSGMRMMDPDRLVYTFTYLDDNYNVIQTCKPDAVGGARMVIYGDIEVDHKSGDVHKRADSLYFGCLSGSIGKTALWGYAPDSPGMPSLSLSAFETATRMLRSDYCGDGVSYTELGKMVTLRDRWLINEFAPMPFTTEAVWGADGGGAVCLNRIRKTGVTLLAPHVCPDGREIPLCGDNAELSDRWNDSFGHIWTKIQ